MSQVHTQLPPYAFKQAPRPAHLPRPVLSRSRSRNAMAAHASGTVVTPASVRDDSAAVLGYN